MELDSLVEEELNRIHAKPVVSDHEKELYSEIVRWATLEKWNVVFNTPQEMIEAYWKEKLS